MSRRWLIGLIPVLCVVALVASDASAQSTYHLHRNNSTTSGLYQLKTAGPDQTSGSVQSVDLKAKPLGEYIVKAFDTQAGVPNATGTLSAGSTITFTVWMKKTASAGTLYPRVKLNLNGSGGASVCTVTGTTALTTTLTKYTLAGTIGSSVSVAPSDRLYVWVGVNLTAGSSSTTFRGQVNLEGTLNGNYDSYVAVPAIVPPPSITLLNPTQAAAGASVVITGTNLGSSQGTSTVSFNGTSGSPTSWSDTSITVPVPGGATSGPVVVTARGFASNGSAFTVLTTGTISGTVSRTLDASPVSGALVEVLLSGSAVASTTTAANGNYSVPDLQPSTYQVRVSASGLVTKTVSSVVVTAGGTATVNVGLSTPGAVSGTVMNSAGASGIPGASIAILQSGQTIASTTSSASGAYTVAGLAPGTYDVRASRAGFVAETTSGIVVAENATTTVDFALDPSSTGQIRYVYDELDRLVAVINQAGEAAIYEYDSVGNLLSISRKLATDVSVIEFTPDGGAPGSTVTVFGTGFGSTIATNAVTFNGSAATVQSASTTKLVVTVPAGATTGPIAVTSPNGTAASSDPFVVGATGPGGPPTIAGFAPSIGDAGSTVVVTGTNFDPSATLNSVFFNGVRAEVTAVSPTSLTVTVPASATGPISVTTPEGTATSTTDFFVPPAENPAATIGSAQRAVFGEVVPVVLAEPNKAAMIVFDATLGSQVTYSTYLSSLPNWSVKLFDPNGYKIATWTVATPPHTSELFAGVTGTYTLIISAGAQTGTMSAIVNPVDAVPPDPPTVGGSAVQATTTIPGQRVRVAFTGSAGQRIVASVSSTEYASLWLVRPNGMTLAVQPTLTGGVVRVLDINPLPESGEYAVVIRPASSALTVATVQLTATPSFTAGGTPLTEVLLSGEPSSVTFAGIQDQAVSLVASNVSIANGTMTILNPDASVLTTYPFTPAGEFLFAYLPTTGTYTAVFDPQTTSPGTMAVRLHDASTVTGSLVAGGAPLAMNITAPGQFGAFTFSGSAGNRVTLKKSAITLPSGSFVRLYQPGGGFWSTQTLGSAGLMDIPQLPLTGTYTIEITPDPFGGTGSVTLSLIADVVGSVTPGGAALPVNLPVSEQRAWITFAGTSGQQVTVRATGNSIASVTVRLLRPDGTQQATITSSAAAFNQSTQTLTVSGTYTVVVDPAGTNTGNITISVTAP